MKKGLLISLIILYSVINVDGQTVSVRVTQKSFTPIDPDGAGPATGSVVIQFELSASANLLADGIPFSMIYDSSKLMATPTNTTVKVGPLAAAATNWNQNVDNRPGNAVGPPPLTYGSASNFNKRMIISFIEPSGNPNVSVGAAFTSYVELTYWTLGITYPQGGYITPEPGSIVAQNELSTEGGTATFPYLSPNLNTPVALGTSVLPVLFSSYDVKCSDKGVSLVWSTETELNNSHFEIEKSTNGTEWLSIANVSTGGNSNAHKDYQYLDVEGGKAFYRIRQVDINGQSVYTNIKTTSCDNRSKIVSIIYPTPAKDRLTVALYADRNIKMNLQLIDATGKIVHTQQAVITKGNNNIVLDVHSLASGQYINKKIIISR